MLFTLKKESPIIKTIVEMNSYQLPEYMMSLRVIAVCAHFINMPDLFKQAKEAHDKVVSDYKKANYKPEQKQSAWERATMRPARIEISTPSPMAMMAGLDDYLENNSQYKTFLEGAKNFTQAEHRMALSRHLDAIKRLNQ